MRVRSSQEVCQWVTDDTRSVVWSVPETGSREGIGLCQVRRTSLDRSHSFLLDPGLVSPPRSHSVRAALAPGVVLGDLPVKQRRDEVKYLPNPTVYFDVCPIFPLS